VAWGGRGTYKVVSEDGSSPIIIGGDDGSGEGGDVISPYQFSLFGSFLFWGLLGGISILGFNFIKIYMGKR